MNDALLILDAGGVLVTEPVPSILLDLAQTAQVPVEEVQTVYAEHLYQPCWSGQIEGSVMWDQLAQTFGIDSGQYWNDLFEERLVALDVCQKVIQWSQQADVALLSNHQLHWLQPLLEQAGIWNVFQYRWVSGELGMAKPLPPIYEFVTQTSSQYNKVIFVDDAPLNLQIAQQHSISGLLAVDGWDDSIDAWLITP